MRGILNIFRFSKTCLKFLCKILKEECRAIPINSSNIDYLYHVVDKEHVQSIIDDGYILVQRHPSDIFAVWGNNSNLSLNEDIKFLYAFKEFPTKDRLAISKGDFLDEKVVFKIKYNKEKYKDIYMRKIDEAILVPMNEEKFYLNDLEYSIKDL